jgi:hypothetical protein
MTSIAVHALTKPGPSTAAAVQNSKTPQTPAIRAVTRHVKWF